MNRITLSGKIYDLEYSYSVNGEKMYSSRIEVERKSGVVDTLNCIIPGIMVDRLNTVDKTTIIGEVRTRNVTVNDRNKLEVYIFVSEIADYCGRDGQLVEIRGTICKKPIYRETPLGRAITDMIIASNRERNNKSDYIPCIAWGRTAERMANANVGDNVIAKGRLQSREYTKAYDDGRKEVKTTYEVSLNYIEIGGAKDDNEN